MMNEKIISGISIVAFTILTALSVASCNSGGGDAGIMPAIENDRGVNSKPTANAGEDQAVEIGSVVTLNGMASSDPDGDLLNFTWSFISQPDGSTSTLWSAVDISPVFIADKVGIYEVQLIVNDGQANSAADTMTVTVTASGGNTAPIANAGPDQTVKTGTVITLDGSRTIDVDSAVLTYSWSFTLKPAESVAALSNATGLYPTFTADRDGSYVIQLVVNDGIVDSVPDSVMVIAATAVIVHVSDTGQTGDFTITFGEDSDYTSYPPSYTVNGNGTVTDNVTLLMWQQQDDGIAKDWDEAVGYCEGLALADFTDWRLPDNTELIGIADYSVSKPAINAAVFPNTKSTGYWSSTEYGLDPTNAWDVMFDNGVNDSNKTGKTNTHYARCVRGGETVPILTDNGDGTVTDESTTLMWQQADDNTMKKWTDALNYCEELTLAAYDDWRLPNVKELMSLTDYRFWPFTINHAYFPSTLKQKGTAVPTYWSSTTVVTNSSQACGEKFVVGLVANLNKSGSWFVRCVRDSQ